MAFLNSILMEAGYKVGRYSSPAVFEEDEIIQINNQNIEPNSLGEIITHIKEKCDYIAKTYGFHPTPFEIETALAFEYFKRKNCDIVLVECGMMPQMFSIRFFVVLLPIFPWTTQLF